MNPSPASVIALSLSIAPAATAASAMVAPVMTVNAATITKDPLFSDPVNHPAITSEATTDPQGFTVRREHASAWFQNSESYTFTSPPGSINRITDNSWVFDTEQRERTVQTTDSFRFEATTSVHTTLDSRVQQWTTGNWFSTSHTSCTSSIDLRRAFRFTLDGPMQLHARFSGLGTDAPAGFKDMFNILALSGGRFLLGDRVFMFTTSTYDAQPTTIFSGGGTRMGVNYQLSGFADDNGIDLTLDISPEVAGTLQELEFRWSLQHEVDGGIDLTWRSWDRVEEAGAAISESVTLTAVPEGATLGWAPLALAFALRRRRSSATSAGR